MILPLNQSVKLVNSNSHGLIALNKGTGILSHPNKNDKKKCALLDAEYDNKSQCYFWRDSSGRENKIWLLNRLDSPTTGLVILAKNKLLHEIVRNAFKRCLVKKYYYAIVKGVPKKKFGIWDQNLKCDPYDRRSKVSRSAKTYFKLCKTSKIVSTITSLKLEPITGRTHQLRMHCSQNGLPILGDKTYGDFKFNREFKKHSGIDRLFLHAESVIINYEWKNKSCVFSAKAELPDIFNQFL